MTTETQEKTTQDAPKADAPKKESTQQTPREGGQQRRGGGPRRGLKKNPRRSSRRGRAPRRAKPEFDQRIISIRRVTRVVAGGRRFSFSVAMVIGDRKGSVGVGIGKATDTALAIGKAVNNAKKNMVHLKLTKAGSIPHDLKAKYAASHVEMYPAPGRGVVSGSSVRDVVELAGIKDITTKLLSRSKNKINNARAAVKALSELKTDKPKKKSAPTQDQKGNTNNRKPAAKKSEATSK